jgi:hypothetical protein
MNGFISRVTAAACLTGGLGLLAGCYGYKELVDPCYPWRYNWVAQQEICEPFGIQVNNGHVLDQTIWNSDFEADSPRLTRGGMDHLYILIRRRPHPDSVLYLATAGSDPQDFPYNPDALPEGFIQHREALNQARIASVQRFLTAETAGRNLNFQVYVHDPAQPYIRAENMALSMTGYNISFKGGGGGGGGGAK